MKDTPMEDSTKEDGTKEDSTKEDGTKEDSFSAMWSYDAENISKNKHEHSTTPIDWSKVIGAATVNMSADEMLDLLDRSPLGDTGIDLDTMELTHAPTVHWASRIAAVKIMVDRLQKTLDELVEGIANTGDIAKQLRNDIAVIRTIARMTEDESKSTQEVPEDSTQDC